MLGKLFYLLYQVLKMVKGCEIFIICYLVPLVIPAMELSLQRGLEECGRLGRRLRLEPPSAAAAVILTEKGQEGVCFLSVPVSHTSLL